MPPPYLVCENVMSLLYRGPEWRPELPRTDPSPRTPAGATGTSRRRPSGNEHFDEPRIKCAAGLALKLLHGRLDRQGDSIGTVGGQRVEDVGDRDDARADGNPTPGEPVGVPAPVPALVMMPNDLGPLREEVEGRDDSGANLRMATPGLPLVGR